MTALDITAMATSQRLEIIGRASAGPAIMDYSFAAAKHMAILLL
jgi:hypothetical protein